VGFGRLFVFERVFVRGVVGKVVIIASAVAVVIGVFVLFASRGFYTRNSRSLIAFKD
jgi:hypothetical protein